MLKEYEKKQLFKAGTSDSTVHGGFPSELLIGSVNDLATLFKTGVYKSGNKTFIANKFKGDVSKYNPDTIGDIEKVDYKSVSVNVQADE